MGRARINIPKEQLAEFCRRHHIRKLALFGSVLREDFGAESDVDVLVEFEPDHTPGFLRLHELERQLSDLLDRRDIDIVTERGLHRRIRAEVLAEAEVQYAEE